jgi:hypothetical protein
MQTKNALLRIAREELLEGKTELLKAKLLNQREKVYLLVLQNEEVGTVKAVIQLKPYQLNGEAYHWKLLDLIVE